MKTKNYVLLLLGAILLVAINPSTAQKRLKEIETIENGLLESNRLKGDPIKKYTLLERMKHYKVPGLSITVVKNGQQYFSKVYGKANTEKDLDVELYTLFQAASVSKPVTALAILKLAEDGLVDLDVPVNNYLKKDWQVEENEFTKKEKVTLRRILTHSAGLNVHGFDGYNQREKLPSTIEVLNGQGNSDKVVVVSVPGTECRYSGGGYVILQKVVEDVTGIPFETYMNEKILPAMNMSKSTYQQPLGEKYIAKASLAYDRAGRPINGGWHNYAEKGPGGLWTTTADLAKYCMAIQNILAGKENGLLAKKTIEQMLTKHKKNWGLGPVIKGEGENLVFLHDGSNAGFKAELYAFANRGDAVIILCNGDGGGDLTNEIVRSVSAHFGWGIANQNIIEPAKLSKGEQHQFIGRYSWSESFNYSVAVTLKDSQLILAAPEDDGTESTFSLTPLGDNKFLDLASGTAFEFTLNEAGKVTDLLWNDRWLYLKTE